MTSNALMEAINRDNRRMGYVGHASFTATYKDITDQIEVLCKQDPTGDSGALEVGMGIAARRFRKEHLHTSTTLKLITVTFNGFHPLK